MYHMVTGRPPFEGDSPSAVMHKHLKEPLTPPDHINIALSAGLGEIIETSMAKNADERYSSVADMLEDLWAVRRNEPPIHAHKAVDIEQIAKIEETARTVDIEPTDGQAKNRVWTEPAGITLLVLAGCSLVVNLIFLVIFFNK
jgi:serine/threonine protein kinase